MGKKKDRSVLVISLLFAVFAVIQCSTFIMAGDDFWWAYVPSIKDIYGNTDTNPNGRYLTNFVTYYIAHIPLLRPLICAPFFLALYFLISKILIRGKKDSLHACGYSAISILLTPPVIQILTSNWISGFTNYVFSIVFSLIYVLYCIPMFNGDQVKKPAFFAFPMLILGFAGSFCVENISIYNVGIGIFFVIYSFVRFKKVGLSNIAFLIGSAVGIFIMLQNRNYSQVMETSDAAGFRSVEIDYSNIAMTFYVDLLPFISRLFFICHIIIAVSIMTLYFKKYHSLGGKGVPKYGKLFMIIIVSFTVYTVLAAISLTLYSLTFAFKVNAIEVAFAFLDLFGLIYMAFVLFDKKTFTRILFFLCSVVLVSAPFLVVKPVTPRCFYATYVFWVLTAGEFMLAALRKAKHYNSPALKFTLITTCTTLVAFFSIANITNFYVDNLRVDYIKEQISEGSRTIELIKLPYDDYSIDSITNLSTRDEDMAFIINEKSLSYADFMLSYWGITEDMSDKKYLTISIRDYFTAHEDE